MNLLSKWYVPNQRRDDMLAQSYQNNFCRDLGDDELDNLRSHQVLYNKVVDELGGNKNTTDMAEHFNSFFTKITAENKNEVLRDTHLFTAKFYKNPSEVPLSQTQITLFDPSTWSRPAWKYNGETPDLAGPSDILGLRQKLVNSASDDTDCILSDIRKGLLTENTDQIKPGVLKHYIEGIQCNDILSWDRYPIAVDCISKFFTKTLSVQDVSMVLEYCKTNEKFMFVLLYPYFFKPLKEIVWTRLLPVFHLKAHSFTQFIKNVALKMGKFISHQLAVVNGFTTLRMTRSVGLAVGTSGVSGLLLLYNKYFISQNQLVVQQLYSGLSGPIGEILGGFRLEGSKLVYEAAKTISTFTNAALAGFLEPKQDVMRQMISIFKKR